MRRPKFALLIAALLIAATIIFWPSRPPEPPPEVQPAPQPPPAPQLSDLGKPADLFYTAPQPGQNPEIDMANYHKASQLNSPSQTIHEDLQIVAEFVHLIHKAGLNASFGDNADITAALTGTQYAGQKGHLFPRQHNALRGGQLVDRWGTPFWFHANGPGQLEIRSAGPDKQLFTPDDVSHNPSPPGLGVTPEQP